MGFQRPSYICSEYYKWCCELGYPELDVLRYEDGSWYLIQYYNAPVVPALTKWQVVLGPMKHIEITKAFIARQAEALDITKKSFWEREEEKTRQVEEEHAYVERHKEDSVARAHQAITRNPALMDRIARNGIHEMDIPSISRHVPVGETFKKAYKGVEYKGESANGEVTSVHSPSESTNAPVHAGVASSTGDGT